MNTTQDTNSSKSTVSRYLQLGALIVASGVIYPLIYLRQNFEVSILESFGITIAELGQCYSMLGVIFVITYLPSGWLADKVSPRWLISLSLALTGLLGLWFAQFPSYQGLLVIFAGWGIATGLTFWAALIKGVTVLAEHNEQGRFFGLLEGGRGLVEAILATIAVAWFAHVLNTLEQSTSVALQQVIYFYIGFTFLLALLVLFAIDDVKPANARADSEPRNDTLWADVKTLMSSTEIRLSAFCILCGYQLFWATYSFSGYLQNIYGMTAVAVGTITVAKLWMRPIGAVLAGFIGDRFQVEKVLSQLLLASSIVLAMLILLPIKISTGPILAIVMLVGLLTYAVRGIFWATLDSCEIPAHAKGLAIGVISFVGYSPDIYLPLLNGILLERFPGKLGYSLYFSALVVMGFLGAWAAWRLHVIVSSRKDANNLTSS